MMQDAQTKGSRWLQYAEHDLEAGRSLFDARSYSDACFYSQQSAERAIRALTLTDGFPQNRGARVAGVTGLLQEKVIAHLPSFAKFLEPARRLDLYFATTRYPDTLPYGAPYEHFSESQAKEALQQATEIVQAVRAIVR